MKAKMKVRIGVGLVFTLCFVLWGFRFQQRAAVVVDFKDALLKKMITADLKSTGSYRGNSIGAQITNTGNTALTVKIPAGTYFKAQTDEEQNLVVTEDILVQVAPKATSSKIIDGYCCNAYKRCPSKGNKFSLSNYKVPNFDKVAVHLKGKHYSDDVCQNVVWVLTDDHDLSDITDDEHPEKVRPLREALAKALGKKNEWYDTPRNEVVDPYGNINREMVSVQGNIEFECPANAKVHQEVQDKEGKMIFKNEREVALHPGTVNYYFKVQVEGWEKGTYYVKLMSGTKVLVTNEFKV